jgi:hypothetical protein
MPVEPQSRSIPTRLQGSPIGSLQLRRLQIPPGFLRLFWQGKIGPAFWTTASLISLSVNLALLVILILVGRQLFALKSLVADQLVGGLHQNFIAMDEAHIRTTILVEDTIVVQDTIPVVFDLPLSTDTTVVLVNSTPIKNATIFMNGSAVPMNLILPAGTPLNINLELTVPVSQTLPVTLNVPVRMEIPVDIALNETDLHEPFVGLQNVVAPYDQLLSDLPGSWKKTPLCSPWLAPVCWMLTGK